MVKKTYYLSGYFVFFVALGLLWLGVRLYTGEIVKPSVTAFLMILLVSPVCEELFFRGFVQEIMKRRVAYAVIGLTIANVVTSVLFSLSHLFIWDSQHSFLVFFPSLIFGYVYDRSQKLELCIFLHVLYNLNAFIV